MTLAQAPDGLRTAVHRTLGHPTRSASWSQQTELSASDGVTGDYFGDPVAISGSTAVVGAFARNSYTGAAYVFVNSGGTWSQQGELTASDGVSGDYFGTNVAISGSTVIVGVPFKNEAVGLVYVFVRSGTTWSQQAELTASDGLPGDYFGTVAISGSTAVVGAHGKDSFTGAAYIFTRSQGIWSQRAELTASDGTTGDYFGAPVAISGSTVVVGAVKARSGAAYVFVNSGGSWLQQAKLTDGVTRDLFGASIAVSGSTVVVGAPYTTWYVYRGAAYVFVRSHGVWSQQAELLASDGAPGDYFGAVAISGPTVVVGAQGHNSTGAAYVFSYSGGIWSQQAELTPSDGLSIGISVAVSGSTAVVGAPGQAAGKAYVFTNP